MMQSMKRTLLFWYFLIQIIAYTAMWGIIYYKAHKTLYEQLDERLMEAAENVISNVEISPEGSLTDSSVQKIFRITREDNEYFQIVDLTTSNLIARSNELEGKIFPMSDKVIGSESESTRVFWNAEIEDESLRAISWRFCVQAEEQESCRMEMLLLLALDRRNVEYRLEGLVKYTAEIFALALLFMLLAALFISHQTLRPVKRLSHDLDKVSAQKLDFRFTQARHKELKPLVDATNSLLERIERAFQRERQLTADVAHELRTPLAGLQSILEIALLKPRSEDEYRHTIKDAHEILLQTEQMMENLLILAKIDSEQLQVKKEKVSLRKIAEESRDIIGHHAKEKNIKIDNQIDDSLHVFVDREKMKIILNNLLGNAVEYGIEGSTVILRTASDSEEAPLRLEIINKGELIAESDLSNLFERFWRGDSARTKTGRHYGLGLPITRALCSVLGLEINAHNLSPDRVVFTISPLPVVDFTSRGSDSEE